MDGFQGHGCDVIVAGAGIIGSAICFELARRGVKVLCIHDIKDDETAASLAAGAMLGALGEVTDDKVCAADRAETDFRIACARMYPDFVHLANESASRRVQVKQGTFIIANPAGKDDVRNILKIKAEADHYGQPGEWVEPGDIPGYRPHKLLRASRALYLPQENYLNAAALLEAVRSAARSTGKTKWMNGKVRRVLVHAGAATGVELADGQSVCADRVILAAGYGTRSIVDETGPEKFILPRLKGGKGSSILLRSELQLPHVIRTPNRDFACGTHVVARGAGEIYVGATNRISDTPGESIGVTPGELHVQIHSCLHEINTSLRTDEIIGMRAGARPLTDDGYPVIGKAGIDNLLVATGTYRNGILMAPGIAEIIAAQVLGTESSIFNPFEPVRRSLLRREVSLDHIIRSGVRDLVSFIQEPHGSLPYERARELETFVSALLMGALTDNKAAAEVLAAARQKLLQNGQTETIASLYYDMATSDAFTGENSSYSR